MSWWVIGSLVVVVGYRSFDSYKSIGCVRFSVGAENVLNGKNTGKRGKAKNEPDITKVFEEHALSWGWFGWDK